MRPCPKCKETLWKRISTEEVVGFVEHGCWVNSDSYMIREKFECIHCGYITKTDPLKIKK